MMSHDRVHSTLKTANLLKKDENGGDALSSVRASTILEENVEGLIRFSIAASRRGGVIFRTKWEKQIHREHFLEELTLTWMNLIQVMNHRWLKKYQNVSQTSFDKG